MRGRLNISFGDGGDASLSLAMRRHANFVEYVPLTLILIAMLEVQGVAGYWIHVFGAALVAARISHAFGLKPDTVNNIGRIVGAGGTALVLLVVSVWAIVLYF